MELLTWISRALSLGQDVRGLHDDCGRGRADIAGIPGGFRVGSPAGGKDVASVGHGPARLRRCDRGDRRLGPRQARRQDAGGEAAMVWRARQEEELRGRAKQEAGFGAFEVRTYTSLIRHWLSSRMAMYFLAAETQRLRGGKSADHARADGRRGKHLGHRTVETPASLADPRCRMLPVLSGA